MQRAVHLAEAKTGMSWTAVDDEPVNYCDDVMRD